MTTLQYIAIIILSSSLSFMWGILHERTFGFWKENSDEWRERCVDLHFELTKTSYLLNEMKKNIPIKSPFQIKNL